MTQNRKYCINWQIEPTGRLCCRFSGADGTLLTARQESVSGFMQHLREHGVESRSIARKLSCLRGFYRWLLKDKRVVHDPTVNIESICCSVRFRPLRRSSRLPRARRRRACAFSSRPFTE